MEKKIKEEMRSKWRRLLWFLFVIWFAMNYQSKLGLADLITGNDPLVDKVLERCPTLLRGPVPPFWFSSRHVQFIPYMIHNEWHKLWGGITYQRIDFNVTARLDLTDPNSDSSQLNDTITLDIFPPLDDPSLPADAPVLFIAPGLRCHSQDMPGNSLVRVARGKGFRSVVVNRRGHTPEGPHSLLKSPRWNLFGDVDDLEQVYWHVKEKLLPRRTPLFLEGISSGCAVVIAGVGQWDKRRLEYPTMKTPSFVSTMVLTPGYDISKVFDEDRFTYPYNPLMLYFVKDHFLARNEAILRGFNSTAYDRAMSTKTLQQFLNETTPFAGFENADLYFQFTNPVNLLEFITTPVYVINSIDDPCCRIDNLYEMSPQPAHNCKTYAKIVDDSQFGVIAVTKTGSHCPFFDGGIWPFVRDPFWTGAWMINSWADSSTMEWFVATLEVYKDRIDM